MRISDNSLIEAYKKGDTDAFEQIVHQYGGGLLGYLIKMSGNREIAEDYFQQTFLKVYRNVNKFRGGSFKSWLFTIATNVVMDGFRRQKKERALSLNQNSETHNPDFEAAAAGIADNSNNPFDRATKSELAAKVRKIISMLPAGQRAAVVLSYYQQMSFSEVAEVMGCSIGTVKRHMYRALKKLADKLPEGPGVL